MKFGINQILNETPVIVRRVQNVINYLLASSLVGTDTLTTLFKIQPDTFAKILGLAMIMCNVSLMMFGQSVDKNEIDKK